MFLLATAFWLGPVAGGVVAGQGGAAVAPGSASGGGQNAFRAVPGGGDGGEQISGSLLMMAAYGLIWFLVLAYVLRLARLQALCEQEQHRLEQLLAPRGDRQPGEEEGQQS
jgi:hypothetical protein